MKLMMNKVLLIYFATSTLSLAYSQNLKDAKKLIMNGNSKGAVSCVTCH